MLKYDRKGLPLKRYRQEEKSQKVHPIFPHGLISAQRVYDPMHSERRGLHYPTKENRCHLIDAILSGRPLEQLPP